MKHPSSHEERQPLLAARRDAKMATSAHRYVRGSTQRFYEWLATTRGRSLPEGPRIWICGDCHVGNLGPVARADGRVELELRDLDQTVIGNPCHDVIRLALSLAMTARASDLPGIVTAHMVEAVVVGYEAAIANRIRRRGAAAESSRPLRLIMKQAARRSWKHLIDERVGQAERIIPVGKRFWKLTAAERKAVDLLFEKESLRTLVTSLSSRPDDAAVEVVDAAFWIKGCSSLGGWRCAALVRTAGTAKTRPSVSLIDIKEALPACAPRAAKTGMPRHNGERVVTGARHLSPFLGERMIHETILERPVFIRELLPQDLKIELEAVTEGEASGVAAHLGRIVGDAHARQLTRDQAKSWLAALRAGYSKTIEAPTWLWRSMVDLVGIHESAYLEHCRRHAVTARAPSA